MSSLDEGTQARLAAVRERIGSALAGCGRGPGTVTLVAISKSFGPTALAAAAAAGQRRFGENYLQEASAKMEALAPGSALLPSGPGLEWHFTGPIQANKTRPIAERFDWVQSLDRPRIAERLAAQRPAAAAPLNVLLEVNISGEASKSGVAPAALAPLAAQVLALPRLRLRGLMAIPAPGADPAGQRRGFAALRALFERLQAELGHPDGFDTLSMGMSGDFEAAIAEGATMVRIGTAIFGQRG